jgi:zinc transporter, ZIP family
MSLAQTVVLGALAGFTIFLGLPVGRLQLLGNKARVALAMFSVGVLAFIFVDVMQGGLSIVDDALTAFKADKGTLGYVIWLVILLAAGFTAGSAGLAFLERRTRPAGARSGSG